MLLLFNNQIYNSREQCSQTQSKALSNPFSFIETSTIRVNKNDIEIQDNNINKKLTLNIDDIKFMKWIKHENIYEVTFQNKQNFQDKFFFDTYNGTLGYQALITRIAQANFGDNYESLETIKRIQNGEVFIVLVENICQNKYMKKKIDKFNYYTNQELIKIQLQQRNLLFQDQGLQTVQISIIKNYVSSSICKHYKNIYFEIIKCRRRENNEIFVAKIQLNNHFLIERELEINLLLAVNPHENVASMVEYYFENDKIILIYPYFSGGTLNQLISANSNDISQLKVKSIMKKILSGLNHIHSLGIIHRDIKMDNIMLEEIDDHKCVKIIDFGFSAFKDNLSYLTEKCGTIGYFPPEIINGQFYNEKCDIYSLAQVFHTLLTGNPMFDRNMNRQQIIRLSKNNLFTIDYRNIKEVKAQQLLFKMLNFQEKRYDVKQCLEHSYFSKAVNLELKIKNVETLQFKSPF